MRSVACMTGNTRQNYAFHPIVLPCKQRIPQLGAGGSREARCNRHDVIRFCSTATMQPRAEHSHLQRPEGACLFPYNPEV